MLAPNDTSAIVGTAVLLRIHDKAEMVYEQNPVHLFHVLVSIQHSVAVGTEHGELPAIIIISIMH